MRVEIAVILLITAFGIMSQMKLWKILKERRDRKHADQRKAAEDIEALDEEVGRRVEEQDRADREEWEKVYGNGSEEGSSKDHSRPDSGVDSSAGSKITLTDGDGQLKKSMDENSGGPDDKERAQHIEAAQLKMEGKAGDASVSPNGAQAPTDGQPATDANVEPEEPTVYVPPAQHPMYIPPTELPIYTSNPIYYTRQHIPYIPDEKEAEEDAMSLATCADTIPANLNSEDLKSHGFEVTVIPAPESEDKEQSEPAAEENSEDKKMDEEEKGDEQKKTTDFVEFVSQSQDNKQTGTSDESKPKEEVTTDGATLPTPNEGSEKGEFEKNTRSRESVDSSQDAKSGKISSVVSVDKSISSPASTPASLAEISSLQNHCSRIHKTYRTNEWAKHLADAEEMELDDLAENPFLDVDDVPDEVAAPVQRVMEFPQTPERPNPPSRSVSKLSYYESQGLATPLTFGVTASPVVVPALVPVMVVPPAPAPALAPVPVPQAIPVPIPQPQLVVPPVVAAPPRLSLRSSSVPAIPENSVMVTEQPSQAMRATSPQPGSRAVSPMPFAHTLIGKRDSILKLRPSFVNSEQMLIRGASPAPYATLGSPSPTPYATLGSTSPGPYATNGDKASVHNLNVNRYSSIDDMPLSERREYLQQQAALQQYHMQQGPPLSPRNSNNYGANGPPSPPVVSKQGQLMQHWRESLKQDEQIVHHQHVVPRPERKVSGNMLSDNKQQAMLKKEKEAEKERRQNMMEERMRMPDMLNAHREAMRRLQANAK